MKSTPSEHGRRPVAGRCRGAVIGAGRIRRRHLRRFAHNLWPVLRPLPGHRRTHPPGERSDEGEIEGRDAFDRPRDGRP
jgi:hypothetical protein